MRRVPAAAAALLPVLSSLSLGACDQVGDQPVLEVEAQGSVAGFLFIDLNGTGRPDPGDDGVEGWQVRLEQPGGGVLATQVTDTAGDFDFDQVPVGRVKLAADDALLGDTVEFFGVAFEPVTVAVGETAVLQPGVTYPKLAVSEVRGLEPGKPVFTTGVALNTLSQDVTVLHVQDVQGDGAVIRVRDLVGDRASLGDSVRVRGRTTTGAGQPLLELGAVFVLGRSSATLDPVETSTGTAAGADGGALDGALVQVRDAEILEVEDLDEQGIRAVVDDGSGPLEIRFRAFLGERVEDLDPDSVVVTRARGLLVPVEEAGETRWRLQPRSRSDYRIDDKPGATARPSVASTQTPVVSPQRTDAGAHAGPRDPGGGHTAGFSPGSPAPAREMPLALNLHGR